MFPPCQPAMAQAQALLSTEHSQIHKQLSACDTTSSLWEQITQCVGSKWDSCNLFGVSAHSRTEPGGSDARVGWCTGICGQTVALLLCGMFLSPLHISQVPLRGVLDHHKLHTKKCVRVQIEQERPWRGLQGKLKEETTCLEETILTHRSETSLRAEPKQ